MSELVLEIKNLSLSFDTQGASASILKNVEYSNMDITFSFLLFSIFSMSIPQSLKTSLN